MSETKINEPWSKGDDYPGCNGDLPIAGIHIGSHGNAVECYSTKAVDAAAIRDHILDCVNRCAQMDAAKAMMKDLASGTVSEALTRMEAMQAIVRNQDKLDEWTNRAINNRMGIEICSEQSMAGKITYHPGMPYVSIDDTDTKDHK